MDTAAHEGRGHPPAPVAVRSVLADVYGVIPLMFWSITLIVSVKYVGIVMRAHNDGESNV